MTTLRLSLVLSVGAPVTLLLGCAGDDGATVSDPTSTSAAVDDGSTTGSPVGETGATTTTDDGTESGASSEVESSGASEGSLSTDTGEPVSFGAADDVYYVGQDAALVVPAAEGLMENDAPPPGGTISVTSAPTQSIWGGALEVMPDGSISYTPATGYWGDDSFEYTIMADDGQTADASVTIHVAAASISLADVADWPSGFVIDGEVPGHFSGSNVGPAGDFNGDGVDDVLVGAPQADPWGRAYVVFGGAGTDEVWLLDVAQAGEGGVAIISENAAAPVGYALVPGGDVNDDGLGDVLVSAYSYGNQVGRTYVVFGTASTSPIQLGTVAGGIGGFAIDGELSWDYAGISLSPAGDVDGDGLADILVGTNRPYFNDTLIDRAYVVFGKADGSHVDLADVAAGIGGFVMLGEAHGDTVNVADAGDLDGDGLDDLLVGAGRADASPLLDSGRVYVVFGKTDTEPVVLSEVAAEVGGYAIDGLSDEDFLSAADGLGDVDGDGLPDFVVGEPDGPDGAGLGRSYVIFGTGDRTPVDLADIAAGNGGFIIDGAIAGANGYPGRAGDVNGDGLGDLVIRSFGFEPPTPPVHVVYGKADTSPVDLADVAMGQGGFAIEVEPGITSPPAIAGAGDVDGDGLSDIILGSDQVESLTGRSYVIYGVPTQP